MMNVLVLCTGNSARSILLESILRAESPQRIAVFSAGSCPTGQIHPEAVRLLNRENLPTEGLRSKSWDEFSGPHAPVMDLVITVCDSAASETCPLWPGTPRREHWGVPDPASVTGSPAQISAAFDHTYEKLRDKALAFIAMETALRA